MSLADLQSALAHAVLHGDRNALPPTAPAPVPSWVALGVHGDTVQGALCNALRLTFPTVDELVGAAFFDQAARVYAVRNPPARARLSAYGGGFPEFLATYAPAQGLPYLPDSARLDLAIAAALAAPDAEARRHIAVDARVSLALPISLAVFGLDYPADLIRAAIETGDDAALAAIDLTPRPRWVAVWRTGRQAVVTALSAPAGRFLAAILAGSTADEGLVDALAGAPPQTALEAIQREVFAAAFCRITENAPEETAP